MYEMLDNNKWLIGEILEELDIYSEDTKALVILEEYYYEDYYIVDYLLIEDITVSEIVNLFYLEDNQIIKVMTLEEVLYQLVHDKDKLTELTI